jgi:hypothetical protein
VPLVELVEEPEVHGVRGAADVAARSSNVGSNRHKKRSVVVAGSWEVYLERRSAGRTSAERELFDVLAEHFRSLPLKRPSGRRTAGDPKIRGRG